jgi:glycerol-3-phosphate dehydrogenase
MIVSKRKFVSEMVKQTLGESISFCKISGPSFADEMIKHFPTVVVAASENPEVPS